VELDWGDGDYPRIAATLEPAAEVLLDAVALRPGERLLDVACGTGNVALAAVARGAAATGVDAAPSLIALAQERAAAAGAAAEFVLGDAGALPVADGAFDAAASCFGVIFAPDPPRAAAEMLRATRPGGTIALTAWLASGPIWEAGRTLRGAFPAGDGPPPRWEDGAWVSDLLAGAGGREPRVTEHAIAFTAASPEAWLADQVDHHPAWRAGCRALPAGEWRALRRRMLDVLREHNEDRSAFRSTSGYLVAVAGR
jgi:SAM-dependent methyltransferase